MSTDFNKLVDLNLNQLNDLINLYETSMEQIRIEISRVYEKAEPFLLQIRELKKKYKELGVKFEATKTFIQMEKGGSLVSSLDLHSLHEGILELDSVWTDSSKAIESSSRVDSGKLKFSDEGRKRTESRAGSNRNKMSAIDTTSRVVRKLSKSPTKIPSLTRESHTQNYGSIRGTQRK